MRALWLMVPVACLAACADPGASESEIAVAAPTEKTSPRTAATLPDADWRSEKLAKARPLRPDLETRRASALRVERPKGHASARLADLIALASAMVPSEERRRWREIQSHTRGVESPAGLPADDRRAFDSILASLERDHANHPIVTELGRRARL